MRQHLRLDFLHEAWRVRSNLTTKDCVNAAKNSFHRERLPFKTTNSAHVSLKACLVMLLFTCLVMLLCTLLVADTK